MKSRWARWVVHYWVWALLVVCPDLPAADEDLALRLPRTPAPSPATVLENLQIEAGLKVELVACEPDVVDPIAMTFDERGRMFVAEMRGYPYPPGDEEKPRGRIRLLEDRDGDGRFETTRVFADGLQWPSGIACWKDGLFVTAAPHVVYLKDRDGDGRADHREIVFTGFGTGTAEDIVNNLHWGLDNRVYGAASYNGGEVRRPDDDESVSVRGRDFRFDPVSRRFEPTSGRGDFGLTFDEWGRRFVCNAGRLIIQPVLDEPYLARNPHYSPPRVDLDISDPAMAGRVHPISPPEPWRVVRKEFWNRWVNTTNDMRASRFSERELALGGYVTGTAGVTVYNGTALGKQYRGNAFVAEPAGNLVVRLRLDPHGSVFRATRPIPKPEFLASPHHWFRPVNFANGPDGCLYVLDMARELIEDPSAIPEDVLAHLDPRSGDDRGRIWRIVPESGWTRPKSPRLHEVTTARLVEHLANEDGWWRRTAQRLLVERADDSAVPALRQLARSSRNPRARLHALWTLDGLRALDEETLLLALAADEPAVRENALRLAEPRLATSAHLRAGTAALAGDDDDHVRFQAALTLSYAPDNATPLTRLLRSDGGDEWIRSAALVSAHDNAPQLLAVLLENEQPVDQELLADLARVVGSAGDESTIASLLDDTTRLDSPARLAVAAALVDGAERRGRRVPTGEGRRSSLLALAERVALDAKAPPSARSRAVTVLALGPFDTCRKVAKRLFDVSQPLEVQLAAVGTLSRFDDESLVPTLLEEWTSHTDPVRRAIVEVSLRTPERTLVLLDAIESGRLGSNAVEPVRVTRLRTHENVAVRRRADAVFGRSTESPRAAVVDRYRTALKRTEHESSPLAGRAVFAKRCASCHRLVGVGKVVGPDLLAVRTKSPDELLVSILDPNRRVSPKHLNFVAVTGDGRTYTGIVARETNASIILRRADGAEDEIPRDRIELFKSTGASLMPERLEDVITADQMADLLSFLADPVTEDSP